MLQSYADVPPEMPEWFWENRIPRAFACLVAGDGGIGKGNLMADLGARHTRGDLMPDGTAGAGPGWVIAVTPEDDQRKVMAWRLRAAKAVLERVFDLTGLPGNRFKLPSGIPELYKSVSYVRSLTGLHSGLVLVDPLAAVSSIGLTSSNIRLREQLMEPLEALAMDTGVALVINGHTVKSGSIAGSVALTQAARMVLKVTREKGDTRIRRVHVEKSNISNDQVPDIAYTLADDDPAPRVEWLTEDGADIIQLGESQQKILDMLKASSIPMEPKVIAATTGISYAVVRVLLHRMAKKQLITSPSYGHWKAALTLRRSEG
jgi:RecA-family ATPase